MAMSVSEVCSLMVQLPTEENSHKFNYSHNIYGFQAFNFIHFPLLGIIASSGEVPPHEQAPSVEVRRLSGYLRLGWISEELGVG